MGYPHPFIRRTATSTLVLRDSFQMPGMKLPLGMAMAVHIGMFIWNPIFLSGGSVHHAPVIMRVEFRERMPEMPKPPEKPPQVVKKVEKKPIPVVKKARKAGLSIAKQAPVPIRPVKHVAKAAAAPPAARSRASMVKMPKFVPRAVDEDAMVSAAPTKMAQAATLRPASNPFAGAPPLKSKSRGIRASDVHFELTDRGGISGAAAGRVVSIPIGDERGETAMVGSATRLHDAPKGLRNISGSYAGPKGDGVGELAGKDRKGYAGRIQVGEPSEEEVVAAANTHSGTVGGGVEIGGPVGDRKILRRHLPEYPAWAEEKGISAIVKIFFTVKADGSIRQSLRIVRSSGYSELDSLAKEALLAWKFSPTSAHSSADEAWGVITFRFTLA